jgi:RNA polymerase sigma-70 factor (ECF subfamily)
MQLSTITDQIPFMGRKKNQRDAFWNLAQNQTRFLYNVAFRYVGNRYDAEDLVQETLYTAYNKFHQLRDSRKFKSWMFIILRNHFLKWQRQKTHVNRDRIFQPEDDHRCSLRDSIRHPESVGGDRQDQKRPGSPAALCGCGCQHRGGACSNR